MQIWSEPPKLGRGSLGLEQVGQIAAFFCTNDLRYSDSCPSP